LLLKEIFLRPPSNPFVEIDEKLPNGFHDSTLFGIAFDYAMRTATLDLAVDISDASSGEGNRYRRCRLVVAGLVFCAVEPQTALDKLKERGALWSDIGVLEGDRLHQVHPAVLPQGTLAIWVFLHETNSFVYLGAESAGFEWAE
jgi:hypothetical protein